MTDWQGMEKQTLSRRLALGLGLGWMAALVSAGASRSSHAQATPGASPPTRAGYARPEMLIDTSWLANRREEPETFLVGFMPAEDFTAGYIPGAIQLDWPAFEVTDTSDASIARWREQASQALASLGVTGTRPVVAYDAGTLFASRLWWLLHYLGHEDAHVLNGGLAAWQQAAGEIATGAIPATATAISSAEPVPMTPRHNVLSQMDEVLGSLDDPNVAIVDARTPEEYAAGHIPGAININYPRNAADDSPTFWKPTDELLAMYGDAGLTPDMRVIPYCTTGVRSAVTFFTLRLIGYQNVSLYTGSWKEWGNRPETPKATGNEG